MWLIKVAVLSLRCGSCCSHTLHPVFVHSSRPVFGICFHCVRTFKIKDAKLHSVNTFPIDSISISKATQSHHTESYGYRDARYGLALRGEATLYWCFAKGSSNEDGQHVYNSYVPPQHQQAESENIFSGACHLSTWMTEMAERDSVYLSSFDLAHLQRATCTEDVSSWGARREKDTQTGRRRCRAHQSFPVVPSTARTLRLNVRTSEKCGWVICAYLKKMAKVVVVLRVSGCTRWRGG